MDTIYKLADLPEKFEKFQIGVIIAGVIIALIIVTLITNIHFLRQEVNELKDHNIRKEQYKEGYNYQPKEVKESRIDRIKEMFVEESENNEN